MQPLKQQWCICTSLNLLLKQLSVHWIISTRGLMQPTFKVPDVIAANWRQVQQANLCNTWQLRTLDAPRRYRTASLGSQVDGCSNCGHLRISYNSCRNRHCPKCRGTEREKWIQARQAEILPVPYFHVVFTLPDTLNRLCLLNHG